MKIYFLGTCSGTEPMYGRKHDAFAIEASDGRLYWFDAGEGCSYTAHLMGLDLLSVGKIIISHPHMDHVGGLGNLLWTIRKLTFVGKKRPTRFNDIELYVPHLETWEGTKMILGQSEGGFQGSFTVTPKQVEDGLVFDDGVMRVTAFHNHHLKHEEGDPWRSFSYRIECEGKVIVYSGDIKLYTDLDEVMGDGCDVAIVETGHFGIDAVHEYMSKKNVGHVFFNHNGREVLAGREAACEKLKKLFGDGVTLCEDGMAVELGENGVSSVGLHLQLRLDEMMRALGFEQVSVNAVTAFRTGEKYARLLCKKNSVALELAYGLDEVKKNAYREVAVYEYAAVSNVVEAVRDGVIQYVIGEKNQ